MSRLDDELKIAFQRQEPSPDFAARVLARLNEAPQPRLTLWQRLAGMFAIPGLRWAAAGAMALLLIIIGVALLRAHRTAGVENQTPQIADSSGNPSTTGQGTDNPAPEKKGVGTNAGTGTSDGANGAPKSATATDHEVLPPQTGGGRKLMPHHASAGVHHQEPKPSAEAEAAKEKVLFALQITSDTLNDVQRAISDDRPKDEKPEPVQNR